MVLTVSETVRAGINAVPKGQLEAAYSLGIRPKNAMRYVILPQAIKKYLASIRGTNLSPLSRTVPSYQLLGSWSCGTELQQFLQQPIYLLTPLFICSLYYLIMTSILTVALKAFEKRMEQGDKK